MAIAPILGWSNSTIVSAEDGARRGLEARDADARKLGAHHVGRAVRGAVVDDEHLEAWVALARRGPQRIPQLVATVLGDDDDGAALDPWPRRASHGRCSRPPSIRPAAARHASRSLTGCTQLAPPAAS